MKSITTKEVFEFCRNAERLMIIDHPDTPKLGSVVMAVTGTVIILSADKKYCEMFIALAKLFKVVNEAKEDKPNTKNGGAA